MTQTEIKKTIMQFLRNKLKIIGKIIKLFTLLRNFTIWNCYMYFIFMLSYH